MEENHSNATTTTTTMTTTRTTTTIDDGSESKDEVDHVVVSSKNNNNNNVNNNYKNNTVSSKKRNDDRQSKIVSTPKDSISSKGSMEEKMEEQPTKTPTPTLTPKAEQQKVKKTSTKERLSFFSFGKKSPMSTACGSQHETRSATTGKGKGSPAVTASIVCQPTPVPIGTPPRQHKFTKSSSIAKIFGNSAYTAKKFEKDEQKRRRSLERKYHTYSGSRRRLSGPYLERFKRSSKEDGDSADGVGDGVGAEAGERAPATSGGSSGLTRSELASLEDLHTHRNEDLSAKAMRTLSRGLGKLLWKRSQSVDISSPDPEYKVSYLGNVLTGWAKGEGCVEKQLSTLWRNYLQNNKPDVIMRVKVCASGLKATTRQHGLTEYWANRITHCCAPKNYPRVFCWIYRHEGRKLKHELRCHAVLCSKEKIVHDICNTLKENLEQALREFKREKLLKQNARLSLANAVYDNPSLPRRKILLSVGGNNYRPPLERSKSAPKLMAIEEAIGEEDGEDVEETNEPEMKACCQKDSLYPAMTLGRRHCRKGHSIRRTGKLKSNFSQTLEIQQSKETNEHNCCHKLKGEMPAAVKEVTFSEVGAGESRKKQNEDVQQQQRHSYGSDDSDEFDKLLKYNDYDTSTPLSNELLPYFDMKLHKNTSFSLGSLAELKDAVDEPLSMLSTINTDPNAHPEGDVNPNGDGHDANDHNVPDDNHRDDRDDEVIGLRRNGVCSDGEDDYLDGDDDMYFRQASILNMLHRNSMRKMANLSMSSDESSSIETNVSAPLQHYRHHVQSSISSNASSTTTTTSASSAVESVSSGGGGCGGQRNQLTADSDEGSISSGCETASTATANQDDLSYRQYRQNGKQNVPGDFLTPGDDGRQLDGQEEPITAEEIYQRLESRLQGRHNSDATTFSSSSSITLKLSTSPASSLNGLDVVDGTPTAGVVTGSANTNAVSNAVNCGHKQRRNRRNCPVSATTNDSDSECSDESGYVEFQEKEKFVKKIDNATQPLQQQPPQQQPTQTQTQTQQRLKPQVPPKPLKPPKPLPRRILQQQATPAVNTTTLV